MPALLNVDSVRAISEPHFASKLEQLVFWIGRFISTIYLKYSNQFGGAEKVACAFKLALTETLKESAGLERDHAPVAAHTSLFRASCNLTFLNASEIYALSDALVLHIHMRDNISLLSTLKRAELIAKLPSIVAALQHLTHAFEAKIAARIAMELEIANQRLVVPEAPKAPRWRRTFIIPEPGEPVAFRTRSHDTH